MNRLFLASLAGLFFLIGSVYAVPARPLYEPPEQPKAPPPVVIDLRNSAWMGKYLTINRIFIFEPDGTLSYKSVPAKAAKGAKAFVYKNRGSWRLEGNVLYFEQTVGVNKVMEFRGTIIDADNIVGESVVRTGAKSQQTLQRTANDLK